MFLDSKASGLVKCRSEMREAENKSAATSDGTDEDPNLGVQRVDAHLLGDRNSRVDHYVRFVYTHRFELNVNLYAKECKLLTAQRIELIGIYVCVCCPAKRNPGYPFWDLLTFPV